MTVPARSFLQLDDVFSFLGAPPLAHASMRVTVRSLGRVFSYASVIDNRTSDPIFLPGLPDIDACTTLVVPAAASTAGAHGTQLANRPVGSGSGSGDGGRGLLPAFGWLLADRRDLPPHGFRQPRPGGRRRPPRRARQRRPPPRGGRRPPGHQPDLQPDRGRDLRPAHPGASAGPTTQTISGGGPSSASRAPRSGGPTSAWSTRGTPRPSRSRSGCCPARGGCSAAASTGSSRGGTSRSTTSSPPCTCRVRPTAGSTSR